MHEENVYHTGKRIWAEMSISYTKSMYEIEYAAKIVHWYLNWEGWTLPILTSMHKLGTPQGLELNYCFHSQWPEYIGTLKSFNITDRPLRTAGLYYENAKRTHI